ncbi:Uncharacterised protein [Acinetobacter baumannii]|nr:Uncharacterised protein [Acinetobacter baumannii]
MQENPAGQPQRAGQAGPPPLVQGRAHHQGDIGTGADQGYGEHRRQGQQDRQFLHGYSTKKGSERKTRISAGAGAPAVTHRCAGTDG